MLEKCFKLSQNNTTIKQEIIAGVSTFLTMSYIIFVNPSILSATGMDAGAVFVATCLAAAVGTLIMGVVANYPIALAPGMGINAFFAYGVVLGMGHSWQVALGAVFWSGILFVIISVLPIREWIINSIPQGLKMAIAGGIGLFLSIIGLKNAGVVVDDPATLVSLGDVKSAPVLLFGLGVVVIAALSARKVVGALLIGMLLITIISIIFGVTQFAGIFSMPPSVASTFLQMDIAGALEISLITVILSLLFVDLFDTSSTLGAVAQKGDMLDKDGKLPHIKKALLADSTATVAGSIFGTSSTTSYIESAAGIISGGRTGLTAVVVTVLFLLSLFLAPLAGTVPAFATASALVFVACMMIGALRYIAWDDITEVVPALIIVTTIPLTFSIAEGIGLGFIAYAGIKVLSGKTQETTAGVWFVTALFVLHYAFG